MEEEMTGQVQKRIVCAANRTHDGIVVLGIRHYDAFMRQQFISMEGFDRRAVMEQGFVDQFGKFYSRTDAWKIAEAAGQIRLRCGGDDRNGGTLYSENLY